MVQICADVPDVLRFDEENESEPAWSEEVEEEKHTGLEPRPFRVDSRRKSLISSRLRAISYFFLLFFMFFKCFSCFFIAS